MSLDTPTLLKDQEAMPRAGYTYVDLDSAAKTPATRIPLDAAATASNTSTQFVFSREFRNIDITALATSGARTTAASFSPRRRIVLWLVVERPKTITPSAHTNFLAQRLRSIKIAIRQETVRINSTIVATSAEDTRINS